MMKKLYTLLLCLLCSSGAYIMAQGLENVKVEEYYISDASDALDTDGGTLPEGSTTYRIYIDLAEGYELLNVFGNENHVLSISTTTEFFNNEDRGEIFGDVLPDNRLDENTVALDSYITLGAASTDRLGIMKSEDTDGSVIGGENNDGGSEGTAAGLLINDAVAIPLTEQDGLISGELPSGIGSLGLDASMFDDENSAAEFLVDGGAWFVFEGVTGTGDDNKILVAQITTDGDLSFDLNISIQPEGTSDTEFYVSSFPLDEEVGEQYFPLLSFPFAIVDGCTDSEACNYDPFATNDDGSCLIEIENCLVCNEDATALVLVDSDEDGICDAEEIEGCTSDELACNYNPEATDEVDCIIPIENCLACNVNNDGLVLIDVNENGVCDAEDPVGCMNTEACNYDELALFDDGSCLVPTECLLCNEDNTALILLDENNNGICDLQENCNNEMACNYNPDSVSDEDCILPVENCSECSEDGTMLLIIDTDEDGICDADEIPGCTDPIACNFNAEATDDDESCLIEVENCSECNEDNNELVLIDTDGDGICDADEIAGCTSATACNYNAEATDDNGSCIEPEAECTECNADNTGLDIIDADEDGICDADDACPGLDDTLLDTIGDLDQDNDTDCDDILIYLGVEELDLSIAVSLFPNPVKDELQIQMNKATDQLTLVIHDLLGQEVKRIMVNRGEYLVNIDTKQLVAGIYLLNISNAEGSICRKFVKE